MNNFHDMASEWGKFPTKPPTLNKEEDHYKYKPSTSSGWGNDAHSELESNPWPPCNFSRPNTSNKMPSFDNNQFDQTPTLRPIRGTGNQQQQQPAFESGDNNLSSHQGNRGYDFARRQLTDSVYNIVQNSPFKHELTNTSNCDSGQNEPFRPGRRAEDSLLAKLLRTKLAEIGNGPAAKLEVEVQRRQNVEHPLHSVHDFKHLPLRPGLLQGIFGQGFAKPSKIQETALPLILMPEPGYEGTRYKNLIAQSQSGTGKTAAFAIGILQRLDFTGDSVGPPQALVLAPTYELALQIGNVIKSIGQYLPDLKVALAVRRSLANIGTGEGSYPKNVPVPAHVVVGTPGTVVSWFKDRMLEAAAIKVFVLDEADVMIDQQGHKSFSIRIHRFLDKETCQFLLFSATYEREVMDLATAIIPEPNIVLRLRRKEETLDNISQYYVPCCPDSSVLARMNARDRWEHIFKSKIAVLLHIFGAFPIGQCIIFCHSKAQAGSISQTLLECGHASVAMLTAELTVDQRAAVIERFKSGRNERVLVATNVLARGIDIEAVTMVVNFNVPRKYEVTEDSGGTGDAKARATGEPDYETYLHRIGRTGRFGRKGISFVLIDAESERSPEYRMVKELEEHYGRPIVKLDPEKPEEFEQFSSY